MYMYTHINYIQTNTPRKISVVGIGKRKYKNKDKHKLYIHNKNPKVTLKASF